MQVSRRGGGGGGWGDLFFDGAPNVLPFMWTFLCFIFSRDYKPHPSPPPPPLIHYSVILSADHLLQLLDMKYGLTSLEIIFRPLK